MKSVKSRLFLILLISLGSIITLIYTRYTTSTKTTSLIESTYLVMRLDIRLLNMRRAEKDFLSRLDADELTFFENNYNAFEEDWQNIVPNLQEQGIDRSSARMARISLSIMVSSEVVDIIESIFCNFHA